MIRACSGSTLEGMRTQLLLVVLLSAALLPSQGMPAVSMAAGGTTVPMLDLGGRPMVDVRINGKGPYPVILDTGANVTAIDDALVNELGMDSQSNGAFEIDELRLGDLVVHGFQAHAMRGGLPGLGGAAPPGAF